MVRLQPHRQPAGQADSVAKPGDNAAFLGRENQILVAHQFADGRGHLRRDAGGDAGQ